MHENCEPLWIIKDLCNALGIEKYRDAASHLDEDERVSVFVDTPGGRQKMTAVTESGLYKVIMLSRKPEAKQFQRWVTHDVLPSIRKHGAYIIPMKKWMNSSVIRTPPDQADYRGKERAERKRTASAGAAPNKTSDPGRIQTQGHICRRSFRDKRHDFNPGFG